MVKTIYHQSNLRKARIFTSQNPYFVTICAHDKHNILIANKVPEFIIDTIKWFIDNSIIICLGFVIMPDHLHWAFALKDNDKLDDVVRRYKTFTAKNIGESLSYKARVWQNGYYDHLLRDIRDFKVKLNYMHNNPVRKGIVDSPDKYLFSTANEKFADMIDWKYVGY